MDDPFNGFHVAAVCIYTKFLFLLLFLRFLFLPSPCSVALSTCLFRSSSVIRNLGKRRKISEHKTTDKHYRSQQQILRIHLMDRLNVVEIPTKCLHICIGWIDGGRPTHSSQQTHQTHYTNKIESNNNQQRPLNWNVFGAGEGIEHRTDCGLLATRTISIAWVLSDISRHMPYLAFATDSDMPATEFNTLHVVYVQLSEIQCPRTSWQYKVCVCCSAGMINFPIRPFQWNSI